MLDDWHRRDDLPKPEPPEQSYPADWKSSAGSQNQALMIPESAHPGPRAALLLFGDDV